MPKIRKKSSKRVGFREKYSVLRKVTAHHAKLRKTARKLTKAGIKPKPGKNKMVLPNSFPNKEEFLNEMERDEEVEREEKKMRIKSLALADKVAQDGNLIEFAQDIEGKVMSKPEDENEKYGGLTAQELADAEMLIDPESALKAANINKKSHWRDVRKVIDKSNVIVHILDARDPRGTMT